jgi:hypothetical protein
MEIVVYSLRVRQTAVLALTVGATLFLVLLLTEAGYGDTPFAPHVTAVPHSHDATAVFAFAGAGAHECAVDAVRFAPCTSPVSYGALPRGRHVFMVRAVSSGGATGDLTVVHWTALIGSSRTTERPIASDSSGSSHPLAADGLPVSIAGDLPGRLYPGHGGTIPVRIQNSYPYPITFTALRVTVDAGSSRPRCDGRADLAVRQSNTAGGAVAVHIPAHSTIVLPAQGASAPFLRMRDLPVNQDGCKGARFTIRYAGIARRVASR